MNLYEYFLTCFRSMYRKYILLYTCNENQLARDRTRVGNIDEQNKLCTSKAAFLSQEGPILWEQTIESDLLTSITFISSFKTKCFKSSIITEFQFYSFHSKSHQRKLRDTFAILNHSPTDYEFQVKIHNLVSGE